MRATTRGSAPMTNHWQFNGVNLVDGFFGGAIVSGSTSTVLTISDLTTNVQGVYRLILSSPGGTTIGSNATLTVLSPATPSAANLVGAWFTGAANLADSSGYTPAGTHDGYGVTGTSTPTTNYAFASDVPPGAPAGLSLSLNGASAIVISNSSTLDLSYINTFDDTINTNGMTVVSWAKGLPGGWNPWVSKYGENGVGWQLRVNGSGNTPCWTIRGTGGNEDMSSTIGSVDSNWHFYAGTYSPVTGIRNLYVDGVLAATQTGQGPLNPSTASRLVIGARDNGGDNVGNYFTGKIYGVRIYNTALSEAQVNSFIRSVPVFVGQPVLNGNKLVLTWAGGSLLQATNVTGPWTPTGATAPYTNIISAAPKMFFRLSNP
ncbi:MAG TPA: LamG domain-containing protein [Verrucomicrobiae bacterium]